MVAEVLARQAEELADRTGQLLEEAFKQVLETPAGRQLAELADGPHRHEKAAEWQAGLLAKREARRPAHLRELDSARDRCLGEAQPYSPECVEGEFSELRAGRLLRKAYGYVRCFSIVRKTPRA